MIELRKMLGFATRVPDVDRNALLAAELARVAQLLEERLTLRFDELAAEAGALRAYVDGQLSRQTGGAPALPVANVLPGAFAERIAVRIDQVDAALDQIDRMLAEAAGGQAKRKIAPDLRLLGRAVRRLGGTSDNDLLRIVRTQAIALRTLAQAMREIARMQGAEETER